MLNPKEIKGRDRELPKGVYLKPEGNYKAIIWERGTGKHKHLGTYDTPEEAEYVRTVAMYGHHWKGMPEGAPEDNWGFIYLITNKLTGMMYVGKKQFLWWDGPVGGYKCTDRKNTEWFTPSAWKDSDWKQYVSSCIPIQQDVKTFGVHNFSFEVLKVSNNKLELHLDEVKEMMQRDVLEATDADGAYLYYNRNIASMEFRAPFRKDKVSTASEKSQKEMEMYYLKPTVCPYCHSVIPFGHSKCEECR